MLTVSLSELGLSATVHREVEEKRKSFALAFLQTAFPPHTRHSPGVLLRSANVDVEVHLNVRRTCPAGRLVGAEADVVVSGVGRRERETTLVRAARLGDRVLVPELL